MPCIEKLVSTAKTNESSAPIGEEYSYLCKKLLILKEACESYDKNTAKAIITELRKKTWSHPTEEVLGRMAAYLLRGDFGEVSSAAERTIRTITTFLAR